MLSAVTRVANTLRERANAGVPLEVALVDGPCFEEVFGWMLRSGEIGRHLRIMLFEARAVLRGLEGIACTSHGRNLQQSTKCDDLGLALAVERARTRSYKLPVLIRRIGPET